MRKVFARKRPSSPCGCSGLRPVARRILAVLVMLVCLGAWGCAGKNVAGWIEQASQVEEFFVPLDCATATASVKEALDQRESRALLPLGGGYTHSAGEREGECARFVVYASLTGSPVYLLTLEDKGYAETDVTLYFKYYADSNIQTAAHIEVWLSAAAAR